MLTINDIEPLAQLFSHREGEHIFVHCRSGEFDIRQSSPHLSVAFSAGGMRLFSSQNELGRALVTTRGEAPQQTVLASNFSNALHGTQYAYFYTHEPLSDAFQREVSDIFHALLSSNISSRNLSVDRRRGIEKRLLGQITSGQDPIQKHDLPGFLDHKDIYLSCLVHVHPTARRAIVDARSCPEENFLEINQLLFESEERGPDHHYRLRQTYPASIVLRMAALYAKTHHIRMAAADGRFIEVLAVPLTHQHSEERARQNIVRAQDILIVFCKGRLAREIVESAEVLVALYLSHRASLYRLGALDRARQALLEARGLVLGEGAWDYRHIIEAFKTFSTPILKQILATTDADSCTIRLFDHGSRSLRLIAHAENDDGHGSGEAGALHLPIQPYRHTSVSAFTYLRYRDGLDHVYVPAIPFQAPGGKNPWIPERYANLGLTGVLRLRETTRSEICFPIVSGDVAIGTLNIESSAYRAFDGDIIYLKTLCHFIQDLFLTLYRITDMQYLSKQIGYYNSLHDLYTHISMGHFSEDQEKILSSLFSDRKETDRKATASRTIKEEIDRWIDIEFTAVADDNRSIFKKILELRLNREESYPEEFKIGLMVILKNLIKNIIDHGQDESDQVIVDDSSSSGLSQANTVRVYSALSATIEPDTLNKLCIAPITNSEGELRFGMFLVGLVSRILGGVTCVDRSGAGDTTSLVIQLPLGRRGQE